ncbi:MAG: transcriptional regulator [Maribacter sp.]|nr:MAG: transcriptional regulator [Maribacter sp.]
MVNTGDFIKRLEEILRYYDLSASVFADRAKVQRSSISHLLSGRNKPSLEFVMKVTNAFPEVDLYWLLEGKGDFPTSKKTTPKIPLGSPSPSLGKTEKSTPKTKGKRAIDKIVIFYSDGGFTCYEE